MFLSFLVPALDLSWIHSWRKSWSWKVMFDFVAFKLVSLHTSQHNFSQLSLPIFSQVFRSLRITLRIHWTFSSPSSLIFFSLILSSQILHFHNSIQLHLTPQLPTFLTFFTLTTSQLFSQLFPTIFLTRVSLFHIFSNNSGSFYLFTPFFLFS